MTIEADIETAIAAGDSERACELAAQLPPVAYLKAMERAFEASKRNPAPQPTIERKSLMFEFVNQAMKLNHVNIRRELAGRNAEDGRTAADLRLQVKGNNDLLDKLSPHLRGSFYMADTDKQGVLLPQALTKLIHPFLQTTFTYDLKCAGYTVVIDHAGNPESAIVLKDCQVNDFKLTFQEGGTIGMVMRVQFHPETGQLDLLKEKLQQDIIATLTPPEFLPEPKPDLLGDLEAKREEVRGRGGKQRATMQ